MLNAWVLADTVCWMIIVVVRWSLKNIFIRVVMPNDTIMPDLLPYQSYIQKRRGEPGLFSFEYNLSPKWILK